RRGSKGACGRNNGPDGPFSYHITIPQRHNFICPSYCSRSAGHLLKASSIRSAASLSLPVCRERWIACAAISRALFSSAGDGTPKAVLDISDEALLLASAVASAGRGLHLFRSSSSSKAL